MVLVLFYYNLPSAVESADTCLQSHSLPRIHHSVLVLVPFKSLEIDIEMT